MAYYGSSNHNGELGGWRASLSFCYLQTTTADPVYDLKSPAHAAEPSKYTKSHRQCNQFLDGRCVVDARKWDISIEARLAKELAQWSPPILKLEL